jgi:hypothetical protein
VKIGRVKHGRATSDHAKIGHVTTRTSNRARIHVRSPQTARRRLRVRLRVKPRLRPVGLRKTYRRFSGSRRVRPKLAASKIRFG